jgi:coenzyme F420-0:L-glutamate ligase / coenzyme F420-1:gamma-L-glutamate ligase
VISILPVPGLPEVRQGDDLAALIAARIELEDRDVVVVAQKVVSKAEGRVVVLADIEPSERAVELAAGERDPRELEVILRETKRIVRERAPLVIAETRHGFVCASAGVDHSNTSDAGTLVLLPLDPDESARHLRAGLRELSGKDVGVIVSDSFGRPFRHGTTDVAIGIAGVRALIDLRGTVDRGGRVLESSLVAVADQIAGAADLARGKASGQPVVVVRGLEASAGAVVGATAGAAADGAASELVIDAQRDLFR